MDPFNPLDLIFAAVVEHLNAEVPLIACFYTGIATPSACAPMLRDPEPPIGMEMDGNFAHHFNAALRLNPAVHDGAVLATRNEIADTYRIQGWSYRLFPVPAIGLGEEANRGSAFNSCLAMSLVDRVDRLYLVTRRTVSCFHAGTARRVV
jgi:hypothetical protein